MERQGYGGAGRKFPLRLNSHLISQTQAKGSGNDPFRFPQYDVGNGVQTHSFSTVCLIVLILAKVNQVHIGSGDEKRGLIKAVLGSNELLKNLPGNWVFNGDKVAWYVTRPLLE